MACRNNNRLDGINHGGRNREKRRRSTWTSNNTTAVVSTVAMVFIVSISNICSVTLIVDGFSWTNIHVQRRHIRQTVHQSSLPSSVCLAAAKKGFGAGGGGAGGGGGGFASSSSPSSTKQKKKNKPSATPTFPSPKALKKKIEQKYGGSTPQEIALGTQQLIDKEIQKLPSHVQAAIQLYRQDVEWDKRFSTMDILSQSQLSPQAIDQAKRIKETLQSLLTEHSLSIEEIQMTLQQITWNVSADAKTVNSLIGKMPPMIERRVQRACEYVSKSLSSSDDEKVLDVGCGYGVLVPFLKEAGISSNQIHGVDLSSEMIRNAQSFYPDIQFDVCNFMEQTSQQDEKGEKYQSVIFCSSLHDLPDLHQALENAYQLLRDNNQSTIIIVHPQGGSHVQQQHKANPLLVPRKLPTQNELHQWFCTDEDGRTKRMELIVSPADTNSKEETRDGYLAVLTKIT